MHSRPLPSSIELERQVISASLIDRETCAYVCGALAPDDFHHVAHGAIFSTLKHVAEQYAYDIDALIVRESLNKQPLRELLDDISLVGTIPTVRNAEAACTRLRQLRDVRKVIVAAGELYAAAMTSSDAQTDPGAFLDQASQSLTKALQERTTGVSVGSSSLAEVAGEIAYDVLHPEQIVDDSIPFALDSINRIADQLERGGLYILAGRPGQGKSVYGWQCAMHAAALGKASVFYPFEMKARQLAERAIAGMIAINGRAMKRRNLPAMSDRDRARVLQACTSMEHTRIQIANCMGWSIEKTLLHARRMYMQGELDLMVVDYLQLMSSEDRSLKSKNELIGSISWRLKQFAGELNIPVLALSQLNRDAESSDGPPSLRHLRDSGSLEQDADGVMFLHPDEESGLTCATVAKNRSGQVGCVNVRFEREYLRFVDLEQPL